MGIYLGLPGYALSFLSSPDSRTYIMKFIPIHRYIYIPCIQYMYLRAASKSLEETMMKRAPKPSPLRFYMLHSPLFSRSLTWKLRSHLSAVQFPFCRINSLRTSLTYSSSLASATSSTFEILASNAKTYDWPDEVLMNFL